MMSPKVSVIVPIYNVEKYIERCVRSLFEQTLDNIEYIFIDDCSPDRSVDIIVSLLEEYPHRAKNVIIKRLDKNVGQAIGRKIGIQLTSGDFVIHCDSDDWIDSNMYKELYDYATKNNCDLVRCNFHREFKNKERISKRLPTKVYKDKFQVMSKMMIGNELTSLVDKLVKRTIVQSDSIIWPDCNMQEDHLLALQYVYYSINIGYMDIAPYHYCYNETSTTRLSNEINYLDRYHQVLSNTNKIIQFLQSVGLEEKFKYELICQKFRSRCPLNSLLLYSKYQIKWQNTFPEIDNLILFSCKIPLRIKFQYIRCLISIIRYKFQK